MHGSSQLMYLYNLFSLSFACELPPSTAHITPWPLKATRCNVASLTSTMVHSTYAATVKRSLLLNRTVDKTNSCLVGQLQSIFIRLLIFLMNRVRGHWVQKAVMLRDWAVCQADSSLVKRGVGGINFSDLATWTRRICHRRPSARTMEFLLQAAVLHLSGNE